jgi:hypothetical protein
MITQRQYQDFKSEAIAKQPIRKRILLSDLKFHTMDVVEYRGLTLGLNREGLKGIVRIIGFSVSGSNSLNGSVGEEGAVNILNALKSLIGGQKREVTIVVTPDRVITRVTPTDAQSIISAETYFDTFERMANNHDLEIQSMSFSSETGTIGINSLAKNHEFQVGNLSDEVFRTGLSFAKTTTGIQADPYQHRLICTNGMVTRQFEESYKLNSLEPKVWEDFYRHLDRIEKHGFVPARFTEAVNRSRSISASAAELEKGMQLLMNNSKIQPDQMEVFFKGLRNTQRRFSECNIDLLKMSNEQKRNLKTGVTHWDLINGITDFASHNYGFDKTQNADRHLQVQAGDLLSKTPDCSNLIMNQPF